MRHEDDLQQGVAFRELGEDERDRIMCASFARSCGGSRFARAALVNHNAAEKAPEREAA